jgi:hypothetical protein
MRTYYTTTFDLRNRFSLLREWEAATVAFCRETVSIGISSRRSKVRSRRGRHPVVDEQLRHSLTYHDAKVPAAGYYTFFCLLLLRFAAPVSPEAPGLTILKRLLYSMMTW